MTVTGRSMITVPVTTGVRMRCNRASRSEKAACASPDTRTRAASIGGPPCTSAATQTAMKGDETPWRLRYPAPNRPTLTACTAVTMPQASMPAKTAHSRYPSASAARKTMVGNSTAELRLRTASCRPRPTARGRSTGSVASQRRPSSGLIQASSALLDKGGFGPRELGPRPVDAARHEPVASLRSPAQPCQHNRGGGSSPPSRCLELSRPGAVRIIPGSAT